jgi:heme exporter protein D
MYTNHAATVWALVLGLLILKELIDALSLQLLKVCNHTHVVPFTVTFIQMCEMLARHGFALAAGFDLVFGKFRATTFDVAVFGSWKATCTMGDFAPFSWHSMSVSEIRSADTAVHSAWRNKFRRKLVGCHKLVLR